MKRDILSPDALLAQITMTPEIISVISKLPILSELAHSLLYDCHYNKLFIASGEYPIVRQL